MSRSAAFSARLELNARASEQARFDAEHRRDPSALRTERAPFLEMLSGYDRARTSVYDWAWMGRR